LEQLNADQLEGGKPTGSQCVAKIQDELADNDILGNIPRHT
jgi:hypothetical protein